MEQLEFSLVLSPNIVVDRSDDGGISIRQEVISGTADIDFQTAQKVLRGMPEKRLYSLLNADIIEGCQPGRPPEARSGKRYKWRISLESVLQYKKRYLTARQG